MNKFDLKQEENKVMWYNGKRWLVKETKTNINLAKKRLEELNAEKEI